MFIFCFVSTTCLSRVLHLYTCKVVIVLITLYLMCLDETQGALDKLVFSDVLGVGFVFFLYLVYQDIDFHLHHMYYIPVWSLLRHIEQLNKISRYKVNLGEVQRRACRWNAHVPLGLGQCKHHYADHKEVNTHNIMQDVTKLGNCCLCGFSALFPHTHTGEWADRAAFLITEDKWTIWSPDQMI